MKIRLVCLALSTSSALASNLKNPVRVRGQPSPYYNSSAANTADTAISPSSILPPLSPTSSDDRPTDNPLPPPPFTGDSPPLTGPPPHPTGDRPPFNDGPPPPPPPPESEPSSTDCTNSVVTYTGVVPETVYVTIDGSYQVTVTASNASVTGPTIMETPLPACFTSWAPINGTALPLPVGTWPKISKTESPPGFVPSSRPAAETVNQPPSAAPPPLILKKTSTVVVTKKTPVPVVSPATPNGPPVTFQQPKTNVGNQPGQTTTMNQNFGTTTDNGNPQPSGNDPSQPNADPDSSNAHGGGKNQSPTGNPDPTSRLSQIESAAGGLASIIASVINSPFVPAAPSTPTFIPILATPTIDGIPVTIGPSSVIVGTQNVALPASLQTTIVVDSRTFILGPSEIIGPSTTFQIENQMAVRPTITQAPSVVTTAGVTFTIGPTLAVVGGTTYRVGSGAQPTTVFINGQTIAIGSDGVVILGGAPTTYSPPMTIADGFEIVVIDGLTISVDQTEAVLSETTYRIGDGASPVTVTTGGKTLTIGSSGVVLASTTIRPTSVPLITATATMSSSSAASPSSSSGAGSVQNSGGNIGRLDLSHILTWLVACLSPLLL